jgi:hypothetical protein
VRYLNYLKIVIGGLFLSLVLLIPSDYNQISLDTIIYIVYHSNMNIKYIILLPIIILNGCAMMSKQKPQTFNNTSINPYKINEYPIARQTASRCIEGEIDEVISGNEAMTIWYKASNSIGLTSLRLPHTYQLKLKIATKGFCYDYFDVTQ